MDKALGKGTDQPGLHVDVTAVPSLGKYVPGKDTPSYGAGGGPHCYAVPYNGTPAAAAAAAAVPEPRAAQLAAGEPARQRTHGPRTEEGAAGPARLEQRPDRARLPRGGGDAQMKRRSIAGPLVKSLVFIVVTVLATTVLAFSIANTGVGDTAPYKARFTDATGLIAGDSVRIAGVKVGQVESIRVADRREAEVSFSVREGAQAARLGHRVHQVPEHGRAALHRPRPGHRAGRTVPSRPATRSRCSAPRPPSTSHSCSTASSRCSRDCRRTRSTTWPPPSSRSSRATAAPSTAW